MSISRGPKILILYAQVQPFLVAGIKKLVENYGAEVLVICWPIPEVSPVGFIDHPNVRFIVKTEANKQEILEQIGAFDADIVYTVGWMEKNYLRWTRDLRKAGKKTVMAMDTQWRGTLKQHINCLVSPFFLKRIYTHAWVPGYFQYEYARRLGFDRDKILTRLYTVDTDLFNNFYYQFLPARKQNYPKNFLFVGRLVPEKVDNMLNAFNELTETELDGWKLIIVGNGSLPSLNDKTDKNITVRPFLQQHELGEVVKEAGAFCLVSTEEPWGMVVQEYAAAGLPLIVSEQCGSHHSLLVNGYNGFLCDGNSVAEIKQRMKQIIACGPAELLQMGERSNKIGTTDSPETWAATLMSINR